MRNNRPIILFPLVCFLSSIVSILCERKTLVCNEKEKHACTSKVQTSSLGPYDYDYEFYTNFMLGGEISSALVELEFLSYLNLNW